MSEPMPRRWTAQTFPRPTAPAPGRPNVLAVLKHQVRILLSQARDEAETIRAEAARRGREDGLREGLEQLREAHDRHLEDLRESLADLSALAHETWAAMRAQMEEHVLDLALQVSREVVRGELTHRPERLLEHIRQGLDRLGPRETAVVRLHPLDYAAVLPLASLPTLRLEPDPNLEPGDFVLESECGFVDGRLSRRFDLIRRQLTD